MNQFTKEIVTALAQNQDLDLIFKDHLEIAVNELLQNELSAFLGYERYDRAGFNSGNSRNGNRKLQVQVSQRRRRQLAERFQ